MPFENLRFVSRGETSGCFVLFPSWGIFSCKWKGNSVSRVRTEDLSLSRQMITGKSLGEERRVRVLNQVTFQRLFHYEKVQVRAFCLFLQPSGLIRALGNTVTLEGTHWRQQSRCWPPLVLSWAHDPRPIWNPESFRHWQMPVWLVTNVTDWKSWERP